MRYFSRKKTKPQATLDAVDDEVASFDYEDRLRARIERYWRARGIEPHARVTSISVELNGHSQSVLVVRSDLVLRGAP